MKYCTKCGNELADGATFCTKCGAPTTGEVNVNQTVTNNTTQMGSGLGLVTKRDIAVAIILSLVTCGIYGIYWFIVLTDDANNVSGENTTSGGMAFLFTLLTCGIYAIYWYYKKGQQLYGAGKKYGVDIADNAILYLILGLFGLGIVSYALIQNDLNKFAA